MRFAEDRARHVRGVRWNEELECFEMRCEDCFRSRGRKSLDSSYWPLTPEFWHPGSMQRCRACNLEYKRKSRARKRNGCTQPWSICRCGGQPRSYNVITHPLERAA